MVPKPSQSADGGGQLTGSSKLGFSTKFCPCIFTKTKMHPMSKVVLLMEKKLKGSPCSCASAATRLDLLFDKFAGERPGLGFQQVRVHPCGQTLCCEGSAQVGRVEANHHRPEGVEDRQRPHRRERARFIG